jgi:hypothetical protein
MDDLDSFFDQVDKVFEAAEPEEPPTKKLKTTTPRGIVVAAASTVLTAPKENTQIETPLASVTAVKDHTLSQLPKPSTTASSILSSSSTSAPTTTAAAITTTHTTSKPLPKTAKFTLFVGNLESTVTDEQLYDHFAVSYPTVSVATLVRGPPPQHASKGFGFVTFADPLECARAKREMDQTWLQGRPIRIKSANPKQQQQKKK